MPLAGGVEQEGVEEGFGHPGADTGEGMVLVDERPVAARRWAIRAQYSGSKKKSPSM